MSDITEAKKGDVVRFKGYALRVEAEPVLERNGIKLEGRINVNGCPYIRKFFITGLDVQIERA